MIVSDSSSSSTRVVSSRRRRRTVMDALLSGAGAAVLVLRIESPSLLAAQMVGIVEDHMGAAGELFRIVVWRRVQATVRRVRFAAPRREAPVRGVERQDCNQARKQVEHHAVNKSTERGGAFGKAVELAGWGSMIVHMFTSGIPCTSERPILLRASWAGNNNNSHPSPHAVHVDAARSCAINDNVQEA